MMPSRRATTPDPVARCKAIAKVTEAGRQCRARALPPKGLCWLHAQVEATGGTLRRVDDEPVKEGDKWVR
jgi:hypothetical protein